MISDRARSHLFRRKIALIFAEVADSDEDLLDKSRDFLLCRRVVALSTADSLASRKSLRGIESASQGPDVQAACFKHRLECGLREPAAESLQVRHFGHCS